MKVLVDLMLSDFRSEVSGMAGEHLHDPSAEVNYDLTDYRTIQDINQRVEVVKTELVSGSIMVDNEHRFGLIVRTYYKTDVGEIVVVDQLART